MTSPSQNDPRRPSLVASPRTGLLPSPFSHNDEAVADVVAPAVASRYSPGPEPPLDADDDYVEPQDGSLLPPPGFAPFFTMITDAESEETYHPSTYYVFADDEPDVLSTAALDALDVYSPGAQEEADTKAQLEGIAREEERYVLVSLGAEGTNVVSAKSLAPNWAITNAEVRAAPTFDGGEDQGSDGLMLMVEGLGIGDTSSLLSGRTSKERHSKAKDSFDEARRKGGGSIVTAMEDLAQGMIGGLHTLDKVTSLE
jgi:hypothetical protein